MQQAQTLGGEFVDDLIEVVNQSVNIMMSQMATLEQRQADVIIRPALADVGTLDFTEKRRCVEAGIAATRAALPEIEAAVARWYESRGAAAP